MVAPKDAQFSVEVAEEKDLPGVKALADLHRSELGFIPVAVFRESLSRRWLFVARASDQIAGFVRFRHRRDRVTTLYDIAVSPDHRLMGIGTALLMALVEDCQRHGQTAIYLKCPVDLPANRFYAKCRFALVGCTAGKRRPLNHWRLMIT